MLRQQTNMQLLLLSLLLLLLLSVAAWAKTRSVKRSRMQLVGCFIRP